MNLKNGTLEDWLKAPPAKALKRGGDENKYFSKYETFKTFLAQGLHKEVTMNAILEEYKNKHKSKVIWLNDHGPEHVATVIKRASELLSGNSELNVKEVFLLLNAIQIHDLGNFYGRNGHERKVLDAISASLGEIVFDAMETMYIKFIAQVHGGKVTYLDGTHSKNTIGELKEVEMLDGYPIRLRLLASILRFADELADDKRRADKYTLDKGVMPKGSEIFHAYAACLDTVSVDIKNRAIKLHYKVPKKYLLNRLGKMDGKKVVEKYLIDEIYERLIKVHDERIYCSKFWKRVIDIDEIWAEIDFYDDQAKLTNVRNSIRVSLNDNDYPHSPKSIYTLCPNLKYEDGTKIDGAGIAKEVRKTTQAANLSVKDLGGLGKIKTKGIQKTKLLTKKAAKRGVKRSNNKK